MASIAAAPLDRLYDLVTTMDSSDEDIAKQVGSILAENKGIDLEHGFTDKKNTLLIAAAKVYRIETVKVLIDNGAKVNAKNDKGETPLYWAVLYYDYKTDLVEFLINKGANVNATNNDGETPLHLAAQQDKYMVKLLLDKGAEVDAVNNDGETPLHWAARRDEEIVQLLIDRGAKVDAVDTKGQTPLYYASRTRKPKVAKLLIEKGADDWEKYGKKLLIASVRTGGLEVVKFFIKKGVSVNAENGVSRETPLHIAADRASIEIATYLVKKGANVNAENKDNKTPLHVAVRTSDDLAEFLINKGANVNAMDKDNETPLHVASGFSFALVKFLIGKGVNVNSTNKNGETPLHVAIKTSNFEIAEFLIKLGASVSGNNVWGATPLHSAARFSGHQAFAIVRLLIEAGANVNARLRNGDTALLSAAKLDNLRLARYLVEEAGADVTFRYEDDFRNNGYLFYEFADGVVRRSLEMLYERYKFRFFPKQLSGRTAGVSIKL